MTLPQHKKRYRTTTAATLFKTRLRRLFSRRSQIAMEGLGGGIDPWNCSADRLGKYPQPSSNDPRLPLTVPPAVDGVPYRLRSRSASASSLCRSLCSSLERCLALVRASSCSFSTVARLLSSLVRFTHSDIDLSLVTLSLIFWVTSAADCPSSSTGRTDTLCRSSRLARSARPAQIK